MPESNTVNEAAWEKDPGSMLLNHVMMAVAMTAVDLDPETYGLNFTLAYRQRIDSIVREGVIPERYVPALQSSSEWLQSYAKDWFGRTEDSSSPDFL